MDRVNGYLDLDEYFDCLQSGESPVDPYERGYIVKSEYTDEGQYLLVMGSDRYYFKETALSYNEAIASRVAKFLNIKSVGYDLAMFNGLYGVISLNYKNPENNYVSGTDILDDYYKADKKTVVQMGLTNSWKERYTGPQYVYMNNLEIIWQALENKYSKNPNVNVGDLLNDLIIQYLFSLLTGQGDRISYNWEIEESEGKVSVVPLYDNETAFLEASTVSMSTNFNDVDKTVEESLREFLTISSGEYVNVFLKMFDALTIEQFISIIDDFEKEIGTSMPADKKAYIINNFTNNRNNIESVLKELNLLSGRK